MKLTIEEGLKLPETEILIRCHTIDNRLESLVRHIRQYSFSLEGLNDNATVYIPLEKIYYIDSVEGKTFLYCGKNVYGYKETLAALETALQGTTFVRISKNCILNTSYLKSVSPLWNHRLEACLSNGEKLIISRNYITPLKNSLSK